VPLEGSFLAQASFVADFNELYSYYKNTRLLQLMVRDGKLLASFQIGERISDIRVFRWSISVDGQDVRYIDNRGERDIALPAPFDFEWVKATREMVVEGRHPHLNILDTLFVETIGGDLTIKVENNTETGLGIYREEVLDKTQSLDDAQVEFARLGSLVLLKVLPYREEQWRYLVYNGLTGKVERIDAIGQACVQLPEDHGIIFPGGYYLQSGEYKTFEQSMEGMRFKRSVRSPNGADVQYIFYHPEEGRAVLLTYNMINRQLQNPLFGHGYARLEDGRTVIFAAEGDEPTRIHPMQIWQTPFCSAEFAARQPARSGFLGKIGNAELVRGVSDLYDLCREIDTPSVSVQRYGLLCQNTRLSLRLQPHSVGRDHPLGLQTGPLNGLVGVGAGLRAHLLGVGLRLGREGGGVRARHLDDRSSLVARGSHLRLRLPSCVFEDVVPIGQDGGGVAQRGGHQRAHRFQQFQRDRPVHDTGIGQRHSPSAFDQVDEVVEPFVDLHAGPPCAISGSS